MFSSSASTVVAALAAGDGAQPLITFYDDATGERTELSRDTMANWVAKTANLLADGLGLGAGDAAAVRLPAHWQTAAVLLGCWTAGLSVSINSVSINSLSINGTGTASALSSRPTAVAFATADAVNGIEADEIFALALAPLAAPFRAGPPHGSHDYVVEVRGHGDHFSAVTPVRPESEALADGTRHADLVAAAAARGVPAGARILVDGDAVRDPITWLVAPLVAGTSVVLCRNLDPARMDARLSSERALPLTPPPS